MDQNNKEEVPENIEEKQSDTQNSERTQPTDHVENPVATKMVNKVLQDAIRFNIRGNKKNPNMMKLRKSLTINDKGEDIEKVINVEDLNMNQ